jgi:hypothetical protein
MKKVKGYCEQKKSATAKKKDIPKNVGLYKVQVMVPVTVLAYGSPDEFEKNTHLSGHFTDALTAVYDNFDLSGMKIKCTKLTKVSQINSDEDLKDSVEYPFVSDLGSEKLYKLIMEAPKDDKVRNDLIKDLCLTEGGDPTDVLGACGDVEVEDILYFEKIC